MSKVLVTGGAGFIGSHLVDKLIEQNKEVVIVDDLSTGKKDYVNPKAKFYNLSINSKELEEVFKTENISVIYHLAAQVDVRISVKDPEFDLKTNILGGLNLLNLSLKYNIDKFIFTSTGGAIYGDTENIPTKEENETKPLSPYGINKLTFENYLYYYHKVFGLNYTVLRFANIYGPRQYKGGEAGVIAIFINQAVTQNPLTLNGDGKQTRDFVFVEDVVEALVKSEQINYTGAINISTGKETNLLDIISAVEKGLDNKLEIKKSEAQKGEQARSCLDNSLAKEVLTWEPQVSLEKGIEKTLNWSKNNLNI